MKREFMENEIQISPYVRKKVGVSLAHEKEITDRLTLILNNLRETSKYEGLTFLISDGDRNLVQQCKIMLEKRRMHLIKRFEDLYTGISRNQELTAISKKYEDLVDLKNSNPNIFKMAQDMAHEFKKVLSNLDLERVFKHTGGKAFDISIHDLEEQFLRNNPNRESGIDLSQLIREMENISRKYGVHFIDHSSNTNYHLHGSLSMKFQ